MVCDICCENGIDPMDWAVCTGHGNALFPSLDEWCEEDLHASMEESLLSIGAGSISEACKFGDQDVSEKN